jgi:NTP pyrophosphatase (non-canonical NTP hydrolase)
MSRYENLSSLVAEWGSQRGIFEHSTVESQMLKCVSEVGELADAVAKKDRDAIIDGIGDTIVTLIMVAEMQGLDTVNCLAEAYSQIKDRRGRMVAGGVFVKEA